MEHETDPKADEALRASRAECPDAEFFGEIRARAADLRRELREYGKIRLAKLKLTLAEKVLGIVAGAFAAVMAMAFLAAAVVFLFAGVAGGLGEATGRP